MLQLIFAAALAAGSSLPSWAVQVHHFNIPEESASAAIRDFGEQAHVQIMVAGEAVKGKKLHAVVGDLSTANALNRLLLGSELTYKYLGNSIALVPLAQETRSADPYGLEESSGHSLQLAQASGVQAQDNGSAASTGDQSASKHDGSAQAKEKDQKLQEIVVTGTHIHGNTVSLSPVIEVDRNAIDRSGYTTTEALIQSIPQAFGGGTQAATPDGNLGAGSNAGLNVEHATAVNLRGLGENATLVLLNGHRMAPSDSGNVVDVSSIPLSSIDHIDILTDGASAIYGADAVAGVVNIILRKDFSGAEVDASYGGASGGPTDQIYSFTAGTVWDTGSIMASYEYSHGTALPSTKRAFTAETPLDTNIINPYTQNSLTLNGDQHFSDLTLYGDALLSWKSTVDVLTPFPGYEGDTFTSPSSVNFHFGASYALGNSWQLSLDGTYARHESDIGYTADPFSPEKENLGRPLINFVTHTPEVDFNLDGRLISLPGGDVKVAVGATWRHEDGSRVEAISGLEPNESISRDVTAGFGEIYIPVIGEQNSLPLVKQLVLSAAVRHDSYSDVGSTTNPKVGLIWSPASGLDFKANWSTSFRPPSIGEIIENNYEGPILFGDPFFTAPSGVGTAPIFVTGGENPNLRPETATNFNVSLGYRPPAVAALQFTVDYYNVDFRNRIERPPFDLLVLTKLNIYGPLVTRFANDAQAAAFLANYEAQGYQFEDISGVGSTGVRYAYTNQIINAAVVNQDGFDVTARYGFSWRGNDFTTGLNTAYIRKIETQFAPGATATNLVNTYGDPLRLRFRLESGWDRGPFEVNGAVNFSNAYVNNQVSPSVPIGSFMTVDLSTAFQFAKDDPTSPLHGTTLNLNAINVFDRAPPFVAPGPAFDGVAYDVGNASPLGRYLSVELQKKW